MRFDLIIILRLTQTLLSLIALALNASVIHYFNRHQFLTPVPGYLIFSVFTSTWTILISNPYTTFAPPYFPSYINRYASLAFELLTTIFWFTDFIAGAVFLARLPVCTGLICNNARAGVAFVALVWMCFCITSYFPIKYCFFDEENNSLGPQNRKLGMSGAERISRARMQRDAANNARIRAESEGEDTGMTARIMRRAREAGEVMRVRAGNVVGEWRLKAGKNTEPTGISPADMRERDRVNDITVSSAGRSGYAGYGTGERSVSPVSGHMV